MMVDFLRILKRERTIWHQLTLPKSSLQMSFLSLKIKNTGLQFYYILFSSAMGYDGDMFEGSR